MHINSKYEIILLPVIKSIIIVIKLNNDIYELINNSYFLHYNVTKCCWV